jgi:hypothetical protein
MRMLIPLIAAVVLIACTPPAEPEPDPQAAEQIGDPQPLPNSLPPPSETTPRYVGRWAAASLGCEDPAWRWEARSVSTQGEVSCEFSDVQLTPTGYTIQASCTAEGNETQETIQLSFAESARTMMVSGGPWAGNIGLTYCAPLD